MVTNPSFNKTANKQYSIKTQFNSKTLVIHNRKFWQFFVVYNVSWSYYKNRIFNQTIKKVFMQFRKIIIFNQTIEKVFMQFRKIRISIRLAQCWLPIGATQRLMKCFLERSATFRLYSNSFYFFFSFLCCSSTFQQWRLTERTTDKVIVGGWLNCD